MADRIRIHTDRLGTDAARIEGYIRNITKIMADMKQSVAVLETMWEGQGRDAFHKAFWEDMQAVEAAAKSMEDICAYDETARSQYVQCSKKAASMIAEIKV